MNHFRKLSALCALALALCVALTGCNAGPKQAPAANAEEAALNFLGNLQNGEFDQAKTYLNEGNPLLYVFPAGENEEGEAPELEAVYRQFCEKMGGITFRVGEGEAVGNSMVYIAAKQYDFRGAINTAMLEAMQDQCQNGGDAFADYAGWMSKGIAAAEMGEEETVRAMASQSSGAYTIDHRGYTDHDFMNLITGGFYDYADFQMAVCTQSVDGVEHTYWVAALGDEVIAYVEQITETDTDNEITDEVLAGLLELYGQFNELNPGIYMSAYKEGDKVTTCVGIDFQTADQNALVDAGIVSDTYRGNMVDGWLSLSSTVSSFTRDGMTCQVAPVYAAEE